MCSTLSVPIVLVAAALAGLFGLSAPVAAGADCNGNGIDDRSDLRAGTSSDCDGDGIPDECQLPFTYTLEDSIAEAGVISDGTYTAWLNRFVVSGGFDTITHVDMKFGSALVGSTITVYVWSDPDGDGNPSDAAVLSSLQVLVLRGMDDPQLMNRFDLPDVSVGSVGTSFFVGAVIEAPDVGGAAIDLTAPHQAGVSWIVGRDMPIDANDLSADAVEFAPIEASFSGNWVLRAIDASGAGEDCNGNGVLDECDLLPSEFGFGVAHWRCETLRRGVVEDSGPGGLDGAANEIPSLSATVPVGIVPQSGFANAASLVLTTTSAIGYFDVADAGGALSVGVGSFTIEAWVKLSALGGPTTAARQWLCQKKAIASADSTLDYGVLVQSGNFGGSGRNLAFVHGTGSSSQAIVSALAIEDTTSWHFVSVAYDASIATLRFGLDGAFETWSLVKPAQTNDGPLRVGAHTSNTGVANQQLRGAIDEMRLTKAYLPSAQLLDSEPQAFSSDCNANGSPDDCEPDCNENGVPDDCDIAAGSTDDDNNGIPDSCETAGEWSVPGEFPSIQAAIDGSLSGSTIIVAAGTYEERIDFRGKAIEVRSLDGPDVTIIDGNGGHVVTVATNEGPESILRGFTITGGSGPGDGGGGILCINSSPLIDECIVRDNTSVEFGGGMLVVGNAGPTVRKTIFKDNVAANGGGGICALLDNTTIVVEDCVFEGNSSDVGLGGAIGCQNGALWLFRTRLAGNSAGEYGGGVGIAFSGFQQHRLVGNEFIGNNSAEEGGGLYFLAAGDIEVVNNLFVQNASRNGGAIYCRQTGAVVNATIVGNTAEETGAGIFYDAGGAGLFVVNSIVRDNVAAESPNIAYTDGVAAVTFCNVEGGWPGLGNVDTEPLFIDERRGDYRLASGSPCIDAGDSTVSAIAGGGVDLGGNPRIVDDPAIVDTGIESPLGGVIDIGAHERQPDGTICVADFDGSGVVDGADLGTLLGSWGEPGADLNGDETTNGADLGILLSAWGSCP